MGHFYKARKVSQMCHISCGQPHSVLSPRFVVTSKTGDFLPVSYLLSGVGWWGRKRDPTAQRWQDGQEHQWALALDGIFNRG